MTMQGNWNYPTSIRFGAGRLSELPQTCIDLGIKRPLLVTDPGLADLPMVNHALQQCCKAGVDTQVFSAIKANPTGENVDNGVAVYRNGKHDGVIAFGGGSGLDAGKAIALMAKQDCTLWDLEDVGDNWRRADADAVPPIIAVPTTAGTGSEVGRAAVITDQVKHVKKIIFHPKVLPSVVIADPELTVGLPTKLTAATGMDALSHNLEAFCAPVYHPMARGIAVEGMRLIQEYLPKVVVDGSDLQARGHMLVASSMGATGISARFGSDARLGASIGSALRCPSWLAQCHSHALCVGGEPISHCRWTWPIWPYVLVCVVMCSIGYWHCVKKLVFQKL